MSPVGFIGLGTMGEPMALNLLDAGTPLIVWNRTAAKTERLAERGARVAESVEELVAAADPVLLMLVDESAVDAVLERGSERFRTLCRDHTLVFMGTTSPNWAAGLARDVRAAGGRYVEAPVSGSRIPAERGELVAMTAGEAEEVEALGDLLAPMCSRTIYCGAEPAALAMKHATNLVLAPTIVGLAEATAFARSAGLDLERFADVVLGGQIGSGILKAKLAKVIARDYAAQGSLENARASVGGSVRSAEEAGLDPRLARLCCELFAEAIDAGLGEEDLIAVEKVLGRE